MTTPETIREHFISRSPWINPDATTDHVLVGDDQKEVRKAGVCWFPSIENVQAATEQSCDLLICHEPLFWEHLNVNSVWRSREPGITKDNVLKESGMAVLRIHDAWDNWPEIGIRDCWARGLGLTKRVADSEHWNLHGMYEIEPQPLRDFAKTIAARVEDLGEDSVQVIGDPDRIITRPALGVGCIGPDADMVEKGADCIIVCYDGAAYWAVRQRLAEMGVAIITVEHGTSELWGIEALHRYLAETFPNIDFVYLDEHARTWTVRAV